MDECISKLEEFVSPELEELNFDKSIEKPEGYICDELKITKVENQGDRVEVRILYLNVYGAQVIYPIGNKGYSSFNTRCLPEGIHNTIEELVNFEYEDKIFEYVQQKVKEEQS